MKDLNINGQVYAKYKIDGSMLFLKMTIQIVSGKGNERQSEGLLIHIIMLVENKKFHSVSYLNV